MALWRLSLASLLLWAEGIVELDELQTALHFEDPIQT